MKKLIILVALLVGTTLSAGPVNAAPVQPAPTDVIFDANTICAFPVHLVATGKGKAIDLPGDRVTFIAPGLKATFTNLSNGKSASFVVTGATHNQTLANGNVVSTVTGLNVVINNQDSVRPGFFALRGTFRFVLDANGNELEVFNGSGQVTDVCALLA